MSRGMREFTERAQREGGIRVRDVDELERYCAFVAGTVGKLLTDLFERDVPALSQTTRRALRARAVSFGIGLQLVNIVKDVAEDFARGDCYLPVALTQREGFSPDEVLDPRHREAALRVLRALCDLARGHLECAVEYTLLWPAEGGRDVRAFCAVPLALALATLREVEDGDDALRVERKSKVTRECVQRVLLDTERSISDNEALRRMLSHYGTTAGTERRAG
jgi:farnesyl-diphosphate farnesyltransferase